MRDAYDCVNLSLGGGRGARDGQNLQGLVLRQRAGALTQKNAKTNGVLTLKIKNIFTKEKNHEAIQQL